MMRRVDRWIMCAYPHSNRDLAVYRILLGMLLLCRVPGRGFWIDDMPTAFFTPPIGLASAVGSLPPPGLIGALNVVLVLAAGAIAVGYRVRVASISWSLSLLAINSWFYSFGKINHDILIVLAPAVLCWSTWDRELVLWKSGSGATDSVAPTVRWPLSLFSMVVGYALFTAGWAKLTTGWLSADGQVVKTAILHIYFASEEPLPLSTALLHVKSEAFWETLDWITVAWELAFLPAIASPPVFRALCAFACLFHASVAATLGIAFFSNVVAYAAFFRLGGCLDWKPVAVLLQRVPRPAVTVAMGATVMAVLLAMLIAEKTLPEALGLPLRVGVVGLGAAGALAWAGRALWRRAASPRLLE